MSDEIEKKNELESRILTWKAKLIDEDGVVNLLLDEKDAIVNYLGKYGLELPFDEKIAKPKNIPDLRNVRKLVDTSVVLQYEFNRSMKWIHGNTLTNKIAEVFKQKILGKRLYEPKEILEEQLNNAHDINAVYKDFVNHSQHLFYGLQSELIKNWEMEQVTKFVWFMAARAWKNAYEEQQKREMALVGHKYKNSDDKVLLKTVNGTISPDELAQIIKAGSEKGVNVLAGSFKLQEIKTAKTLAEDEAKYLSDERRMMLDLFGVYNHIFQRRQEALKKSQRLVGSIEKIKDPILNLIEGGNYDGALLGQHVDLNRTIKYLGGFTSTILANLEGLHRHGCFELVNDGKLLGNVKSEYGVERIKDVLGPGLPSPDGYLIDVVARELPSNIRTAENGR
ncbi:MAG: hypothetical protein KAT77_00425 [Nanoarchaeota archaeon]|nr:hypothetical protein [Nanoarchaeota archaeon]